MITWNIGPCAKRSRRCEAIDQPDLDDESTQQLYEFMRVVNNRLGTPGIILNFLKDCSTRWLENRPITLLDMRCGRGDTAMAIARWGRQKKIDLRIFAVDPRPSVVKLARRHCEEYKEITIESRDYDDPQFLHAQQFDYVISALTLHRFSQEESLVYLKKINLLAKRGIIVIDWLRDLRAYLWMKVVTHLWEDEVIRQDGPLAIQKGLPPKEVRAMIKQAEIEYALLRIHFGYRFSIAGERALAQVPQFQPLTSLAGT